MSNTLKWNDEEEGIPRKPAQHETVNRRDKAKKITLSPEMDRKLSPD